MPTKTPAFAPLHLRVTGIATGEGHTCVSVSNGKVTCWGKNEFGQIGNGLTGSMALRTPVEEVMDARGITAGWAHTCALLESGDVKCWGYNKNGELGNGRTEDANRPVLVQGLAGKAVSLAAGDDHTCAVLEDGSVMCWGFNETGQLGDGTKGNQSLPVAVRGLAGRAVAVTAGWGHTCALLETGKVQCWGANGSGQLGGNSAAELSLSPVTVYGLTRGVAAIAARGGHTCALRETGDVECWGSNKYGELGDGTAVTRNSPVPVKELGSKVRSIAAGWNHTCATLETGKTMCWGWNYYGQLGDGSLTTHVTPVSVAGLPGSASLMSLGWRHSCAVIEPGLVKCWGANEYGQGWDGWVVPNWSSTPTAGSPAAASPTVTVTPEPTKKPATAKPSDFQYQPLDAGGNRTCAVTESGEVKCWGSNESGWLGVDPLDVPGINGVAVGVPQQVFGLWSKVRGIATGGAHACALTAGQTVVCWGSNYSGEIGDGTLTDRPHPVAVAGLPGGVTSIAAGGGHSCAVAPDGVWCWGANNNNQIGKGASYFQPTAFRVPGLPAGIRMLSTISDHTCALTRLGGAVCWGLNEHAQLGDGSTAPREEPVMVPGFAGGVISIAAGQAHSCAVTTGGAVYCWGDNSYGQLGDGSGGRYSFTPVKVAQGEDKAVQVIAGFYHTCYLTDKGKVKCWGLNDEGQLGNGTTANSPTPTAILLVTVTFLEAGDAHTCAMEKKDSYFCWGRNLEGQLGNAQDASSSYPVHVFWNIPE